MFGPKRMQAPPHLETHTSGGRTCVEAVSAHGRVLQRVWLRDGWTELEAEAYLRIMHDIPLPTVARD